MVRLRKIPGTSAFVFATLLALVTIAPVPAMAAGHSVKPAVTPAAGSSQSSEAEEDSDQPSHLTIMRDFNHDGIPDRAEAGPGFLTISLGQPSGAYTQASRFALSDRPRDMVTGDFNHDGVPDLIVGEDHGAIDLFLGDGTGNFVPAGEIAHLQSVGSIAVADFNHDGLLDLAVSDWRGSLVAVLLGTGKGSFRSGFTFPLRMAGTTPTVTSADFNGDGVPDLAVVYEDGDQSTFDVMLGNGNGSFTYAPQLSLVKDPNAYCPT